MSKPRVLIEEWDEGWTRITLDGRVVWSTDGTGTLCIQKILSTLGISYKTEERSEDDDSGPGVQ